MACTRSRGAGLMRAAPTISGGAYAWGGSISRITEASFITREDAGNLHGARIHVDALRYRRESPTADGYVFYRLGAWRVAVAAAAVTDTAAILRRIEAHGPAAAGYIRMGDTLVPAALCPSARAALVASP